MTTEPFPSSPPVRLEVLADIVRDELLAAGLPLTHRAGAGAAVSVDSPDHRGVVVHWQQSSQFNDALMAAWGDDPHHEGEEFAAFTKQGDAVREAMAEALLEILTAAGFAARRIDSAHVSDEILVTQRLATSPWQARRSARSAARMDKMQAAWAARSAAGCGNPDCETHCPSTDGTGRA
ncbi:hypothetical protein [Amycolatopsis sp. cg13]|uniref:hypothetical protein n=1 Tax=Amycolatopsis sp. cg13 TaxID=3238807 RepID=UPI0035231863